MCDAGAMGQLEQIWSDAAAEVHQIVVGPMDNNVYILRCRRTGDAMLIDAANEHEELLEICRQLGVNQVVETHGHWDHIQAVPAVREAGISVAVTSADAGHAAQLRPHIGGRRAAQRGRPAHQDPGHARPHPGLHLLRRRGHEPAVHGRHALPRRPGQHVLRERRLRHHHRVDRPPHLRRLRPGHAGPARPRGRRPRWGTRLPTWTNGSSEVGEGRRAGSAGVIPAACIANT